MRSTRGALSVLSALSALASVVGLVLAGASPVAAQESDPAPVEIVDVDRSDEPTVTLTISISGGTQTSLSEADIAVTEDGEPRDLTVTPLSNDSLAVVLVVDTSGSMAGEPIDAAKAAARSFVAGLPAGTRMAVVGFGDAPALASGFTTDTGAVVAAIDALQAQGETALYDAVAAAVAQFPADAESRRTMVLLSDGGDTVSQATLENAVATLGAADAQFFGVALATEETNTAALATLADAAGGRVLDVTETAQLSAVYDALAAELVNQYQVSFTSARTDASEVVLAVTADGVSGSQRVFLEPPPASPVTAPETPRVSVPAPEPFTPDLSLLEQGWILWVGAGTVFLALALVLSVLIPEEAGPLSRFRREDERPEGSPLHDAASRVGDLTERLVGRSTLLPQVQRSITTAGVALRAGEAIALSAALGLAGLIAGISIGGLLLGVILAVFAGLMVPAYVSAKAASRRRKFEDQLVDAIPMLAGSLRAGYGLVQGIDNVAREAESPLADEFARVLVENRLGRDLGTSLRDVAERTRNEDFKWVVQAIEIHRQVGGDLAKILDTVADTIRSRNRLRRQVRVLSAEGRASAFILMALPFVVMAMVLVSSPGYLDELFNTTTGNILLAVGAVLLLTGAVWLRRITQAKF